MAGTNTRDSMRIRALVHDKVMLILIDSRSSHSFVSQAFVWQVGLQPVPTTNIRVQVANGENAVQYVCS
jgi:hypothetical protein